MVNYPNKREIELSLPSHAPEPGLQALTRGCYSRQVADTGLHGTRPQHGRLSLIGCKQCRRLQGRVAPAPVGIAAHDAQLSLFGNSTMLRSPKAKKNLMHSAMEGFNRLTQFR